LPHLASNLKELFSILEKRADAEIFFAPIGRMFSRVVLWDFRRSKESSRYLAPAREVIAVPEDWILLPMVQKYFPHHLHKGILYFYCSVPQVIPLHLSFAVRYHHTVIGKVDFVDRSMISEYHPYVRQSNTNLIITTKHQSMNVCICSLQTDADIAKLVLNFFPDGECPLYFLQEVVLFAGSSANTIGMEKWKDLRPQAILRLGASSTLDFKIVMNSAHCGRFNPWCEKCREEIFGDDALSRPCGCYHQDIVMANSQVHVTGKRGGGFKKPLAPASVDQLKHCSKAEDEEIYLVHDYLRHSEKDPLDIDPLTDLPSVWDIDRGPNRPPSDSTGAASTLGFPDPDEYESSGLDDEENQYV